MHYRNIPERFDVICNDQIKTTLSYIHTSLCNDIQLRCIENKNDFGSFRDFAPFANFNRLFILWNTFPTVPTDAGRLFDAQFS